MSKSIGWKAKIYGQWYGSKLDLDDGFTQEQENEAIGLLKDQFLRTVKEVAIKTGFLELLDYQEEFTPICLE